MYLHMTNIPPFLLLLWFAYMLMLMMFWFCTSPVAELFLSISCIISGSSMVYFLMDSSWFFYIMILSIVGGFMVLLSFVMMISPNSSFQLLMNLNQFLAAFLSFISFILVMCMSSEVQNLVFSTFFHSTPLWKSGHVYVYPFTSSLLFFIILLLLMLIVIDSIVITEGGSMLIF